ncbi:MAG: S1C family serine protease [Phocaeicola sp.]
MLRLKSYCLLLVLFSLLFNSCSKAGRRGREVNKSVSTTRSSRPLLPVSSSLASSEEELTGVNVFKRYNSAVFMIHTTDGAKSYQGSGFFIAKNGVAVSNYHVFKGTTKGYEEIILISGDRYKIEKVIDYSEKLDYIVFKVNGTGPFNYIPIERIIPQIGEKVYTIGSPLGLENTFSSGEVSQIRDEMTIQISAPIDHGSSGGALINSRGKAIGITTGGHDNSGANLNFAMSVKVLP